MVGEEELAQVLAQGSPSVAAWNLVERANQYGGKDNITALVLQIGEIVPWVDDGAEEGAQAADGAALEGGGQAVASSSAARVNGYTASAQPLSSASAPGDAVVETARPARGGLMQRLFGRG